MNEAHLAQFIKGIELFNRQKFYNCHDVIEEIWLQESSDQGPFLQGLIQASVAFYHYRNGKWGAARALFRQAVEKLEPYPEGHCGVGVKALVVELNQWKMALDESITLKSRVALTLPYPRVNLLTKV